MSFIRFDLDTFRKVLKPTNGWTETMCQRTFEYVYYQEIKGRPDLRTKVHSTVNLGTNISRRKGRDSIKVSIVRINAAGIETGVLTSIHVHRTQNWVKHLFNAINSQTYQARRTTPPVPTGTVIASAPIPASAYATGGAPVFDPFNL